MPGSRGGDGLQAEVSRVDLRLITSQNRLEMGRMRNARQPLSVSSPGPGKGPGVGYGLFPYLGMLPLSSVLLLSERHGEQSKR